MFRVLIALIALPITLVMLVLNLVIGLMLLPFVLGYNLYLMHKQSQ
jgi:hypothetical protein